MKVIIDNKIPYIEAAIKQIASEVLFVPGSDFTPELVRNADALIVRTRTHCDQKLLDGSSVKFIATATIGYDHIDTTFCEQKGIAWSNAPGCNADSVAQYIESSLLLWQLKTQVKLQELTIGIIGVGHVGKKVAEVAKRLGLHVLLNDPPREKEEKSDAFVSLQEIASACDIITFHTPLSRDGLFGTFHLGDRSFFQSLQRKPLIINSSRGEVVETSALLEALQSGVISNAIIDVWENEPNIHLDLLANTFIGTPHIAGYSADGKANATRMSLDSLCRFFNLKAAYKIAPPAPQKVIIRASSEAEALLQIYNPLFDSTRLKAAPNLFEQLRGNYPLRREAHAYQLCLEQKKE